MLLSLAMNGFYGLKNLRGNRPLDVGKRVANLDPAAAGEARERMGTRRDAWATR
jgi:hypothetical protein